MTIERPLKYRMARARRFSFTRISHVDTAWPRLISISPGKLINSTVGLSRRLIYSLAAAQVTVFRPRVPSLFLPRGLYALPSLHLISFGFICIDVSPIQRRAKSAILHRTEKRPRGSVLESSLTIHLTPATIVLHLFHGCTILLLQILYICDHLPDWTS